MRQNVLCDLHGFIAYFSLYYITTRFWKKKIIELEICVLIFLKIFSEKIVIVRRIRQDKNVNVFKSICKIHVLLVIF